VACSTGDPVDVSLVLVVRPALPSVLQGAAVRFLDAFIDALGPVFYFCKHEQETVFFHQDAEGFRRGTSQRVSLWLVCLG